MKPNVPDACPDPELLIRLAGSALPDAMKIELIDHLDHCSHCQRLLDSKYAADPFVDTVAQQLKQTPHQSPGLRKKLDQLRTEAFDTRTLRQDARPAELVYADVLPWLDPSGGNGIGRVATYELLECLGRGGMGVVFKAQDIDLQRTVAVKFLAPNLAADDDARQRFFREARAVASINHPHVVTVHTVSECSGLPFLVMEFMPAGSLQQRIQRRGRLPFDEAIRFGRNIVSGLAAAHAQDIIHRDVKPANILLETPSGPAKISDFGLARVLGNAHATQSGIVVGTPAYLAPESIDPSFPVDHRSDLFSLGSVLYAMSAGQPPFGGDSVPVTLQQIHAAQPVPLARVNPDVPAWFSGIVEKLHKKNPDLRYQTAAEVEHDLQRSVLPLVPSRPLQAKRWYVPIGVACLVLLILSVGYGLLPSNHSPSGLKSSPAMT